MISRGRKYAGMAGVPLPLSLNDIELYLASRTILIDRIEFDAAILATSRRSLNSASSSGVNFFLLPAGFL
ncbi:hypothetical protein [Klebsiella pneumoniae]|uniref:hypothetical protein n=1 Tax=Klebsiella pneumoniae TaxID=573 RepID=UPI0029FF336C|nr:hypothetical protein [Klebsiella pneumoniae]